MIFNQIAAGGGDLYKLLGESTPIYCNPISVNGQYTAVMQSRYADEAYGIVIATRVPWSGTTPSDSTFAVAYIDWVAKTMEFAPGATYMYVLTAPKNGVSDTQFTLQLASSPISTSRPTKYGVIYIPTS